jgi:hypothetical protein
MNKETFEAIIWPEEFFVEYKDGKKQLFVSSQGVTWDNGQDNDRADENRVSVSCCWQKKSQSQQIYRHIEFFVDEIETITSKSGDSIWASKV